MIKAHPPNAINIISFTRCHQVLLNNRNPNIPGNINARGAQENAPINTIAYPQLSRNITPIKIVITTKEALIKFFRHSILHDLAQFLKNNNSSI